MGRDCNEAYRAQAAERPGVCPQTWPPEVCPKMARPRPVPSLSRVVGFLTEGKRVRPKDESVEIQERLWIEKARVDL